MSENVENDSLSYLSQLDRIVHKFGLQTDKSMWGHGYNKIYSKYFDEIRGKEIKFLEIGCAHGASTQMWAEYFSNSQIITLDHDIKQYKYPDHDRIKVIKGSQTDVDVLLEINNKYGPFDIIVDDGSHVDAYTKITFDTLFPHLNASGYYVVEDLHVSYHKSIHGIENEHSKMFMDHLKTLIDYTNSHGHCMAGNVLDCLEQRGLGYPICSHHKMEEMDKVIEFIHFYKSLAFVKKY